MNTKTVTPPQRSARLKQGEKHRDAKKVERIPVKVVPSTEIVRKPAWLRVPISTSAKVHLIKNVLRKNRLSTVCEEASCPNLNECFSNGTATFMIMGDICTRRCPFCDVGHGKPMPLDKNEPKNLSQAIAEMSLKYVVITSVDRDDLRDGGAQHFADCISSARQRIPELKIEVLVPDFRGRMEVALDILSDTPPDVFNHNIETIPSLYRKVRPGANYEWSLNLLSKYLSRNPTVPTKSGLMVGLGETKADIFNTIGDLRSSGVTMLTVGQYLQPSVDHL